MFSSSGILQKKTSRFDEIRSFKLNKMSENYYSGKSY